MSTRGRKRRRVDSDEDEEAEEAGAEAGVEEDVGDEDGDFEGGDAEENVAMEGVAGPSGARGGRRASQVTIDTDEGPRHPNSSFEQA